MPYFSLLLTLVLFCACSSTTSPKPLKRTYWSLVELNGHNTQNEDHQPPSHLLFHVNDNTLHGSDGCNSIQANYTQKGENFHFTSIHTSKIICKEGSTQAKEFLKTLQKTSRFIIDNNEMFFYNKEEEIAHFEAKED